MSKLKSCGAAAFSLALVAWSMAPALAAIEATGAHATAGDRTAQRDFLGLSSAGAEAFDDVALARLAIFDGHPVKAETLIASAQMAFDRAATDRTAFIKAENALQPPSSLRSTSGPVSTASATRITWIPVAEGFVVNETLAPSRETARAVDKANQSIKSQSSSDAMKALKVAKVSAVDTVALAPLQASLSNIHRASQLASAADYYGASQSLRSLEDSIRYDTVDVSGTPKTSAQTQAANTPSGDHVKP